MNATSIFKRPRLWGLLAGFVTAPLLAGTEVTVRTEDKQGVEQVGQAPDEMGLEAAQATPAEDHALAVSQARSGARILASVESECRLSVNTESPEDQDVEARFLRLMQTR